MRAMLTSLLLLLMLSNGKSTTHKVPQDFARIQQAIEAAANGDTVLVSEGIYYENLLMTKKIVLGSYFILDRDTSHISRTVIDGSTPRHPDSASVILITTGTDSTTVISGFTLQRGRGTRVFDSTYWFQYWRNGGGIALQAGGARIAHNIIANDTIIASEGVVGGGICVWPQDGPISYWIIEHNQIHSNYLHSSSLQAAAEAGGVHLTEQGRFTHNVVMNNSVSGSYYGSGGGVWIVGAVGYGSTTIELFNNYICKNTVSHWGGGVVAAINQTSRELTTTTFINNIICNNSAGVLGGAIHFQSGIHTLINNTIANNSGPDAINVQSSFGALVMRMMNNILWNPSVTYEYRVGGGSYSKNRYSNYNCVRTGLTGTGNTTNDPYFVAGDTLYQLSAKSSCIGTGISSDNLGGITYSAPPLDFLNMPRPRGAGTRPDMGAIENDLSVSVSVEKSQILPSFFTLEQNFPNPFNPATTIRYALPSSAHVRLTVYNLLGREIETLVNEEQSAGWKEVLWNGGVVSSGLYFYRLQAGAFVDIKKMLLLK